MARSLKTTCYDFNCYFRHNYSALRSKFNCSGGSRGGARGVPPLFLGLGLRFGPGGPPLFLDQIEARRGRKKFFFETACPQLPPPSSSHHHLPLIWRSGSVTDLLPLARYVLCYIVTLETTIAHNILFDCYVRLYYSPLSSMSQLLLRHFALG